MTDRTMPTAGIAIANLRGEKRIIMNAARNAVPDPNSRRND
jgi:hypothetical protein